MDIDVIDKEFKKLISQRNVGPKLGETNNYIKQLRYKDKNGIGIGMETKIRLLQKSGWKQEDGTFTRKDLVSLLNFYKRTSQAARDMGPEYVIDKWQLRPK